MTMNAVAVITDIHGNLPALQAALARIDELAVRKRDPSVRGAR
jgi:hypothetical protein